MPGATKQSGVDRRDRRDVYGGSELVRRVRTEKLPVGDIVVGRRWREPSAKQIEALRQSLRENGLLEPIGVRFVNRRKVAGKSPSSTPVLVYGATRLAAAKLEGWTEIAAQILEGSDVDFEKAELAENLHRHPLTRLQRDQQIARYAELCRGEGILRDARAKRGRGRPEGGLRAAARQLELAESTARDALRVATLTHAAAAGVAELGLADKPVAYRAVAAEPTEAAQIAKAREIAGREGRGHRGSKKQDRSSQVKNLMQAWEKAAASARQTLLAKIGHAGCRKADTSQTGRRHSRVGGNGAAPIGRQRGKPKATGAQLDLWPHPERVDGREECSS